MLCVRFCTCSAFFLLRIYALLRVHARLQVLLEVAGILSFIAYAADTNQPINWCTSCCCCNSHSHCAAALLHTSPFATSLRLIACTDLGVLLEAVTFLSCTYAHFQEGAATSAMAGFKNMLPQKATGSSCARRSESVSSIEKM